MLFPNMPPERRAHIAKVIHEAITQVDLTPQDITRIEPSYNSADDETTLAIEFRGVENRLMIRIRGKVEVENRILLPN